MDTLIGVAVTMHIMSAVIAFVAANYTYRYMRRSEAFFVVKERIPFLTLGLTAFGLASLLDTFSLLAGLNMQLSLGAIIRMLALIQIMYGAITLLNSIQQPVVAPAYQPPERSEPPLPSAAPEDAGVPEPSA